MPQPARPAGSPWFSFMAPSSPLGGENGQYAECRPGAASAPPGSRRPFTAVSNPLIFSELSQDCAHGPRQNWTLRQKTVRQWKWSPSPQPGAARHHQTDTANKLWRAISDKPPGKKRTRPKPGGPPDSPIRFSSPCRLCGEWYGQHLHHGVPGWQFRAKPDSQARALPRPSLVRAPIY
jgi:hypothetical protein